MLKNHWSSRLLLLALAAGSCLAFAPGAIADDHGTPPPPPDHGAKPPEPAGHGGGDAKPTYAPLESCHSNRSDDNVRDQPGLLDQQQSALPVGCRVNGVCRFV